MTKQIQPIDRFTLFEMISYLYWKIYKFYTRKGYTNIINPKGLIPLGNATTQTFLKNIKSDD